MFDLDETVHAVVEHIENDPAIVGLFLYGSRADGTHRPDSDYDFGLVYADPIDTESVWLNRAALKAIALTEALKLPDKTLSMIDLTHAPYPLALKAIQGIELVCKNQTRVEGEMVRITALFEETYGRLPD